MSVYKRLVCGSCGRQTNVEKELPVAPSCERCAGVTSYSTKWYVSCTLPRRGGGTEKVRKAVSKLRKDAVSFEAKLIHERNSGILYEKPVGAKLFKDVVVDFVEDLRRLRDEKQIAPTTFDYYEKRARINLLPEFGASTIQEIEKEKVDTYRTKRLAVVSPASVNRELATLKRVLSFCVEKKWLKENPLAGYAMLSENNERDRVLTLEEIERLYDASCDKLAPKRLRVMLVVALGTGLRLDGVLSLRWEEINFKTEEIVKVVKHHRQKGTKTVRIPIKDITPYTGLPTVLSTLRKWQVEQGAIKGLVFPSSKAKRGSDDLQILGTSNFGLEKACRRAGIKDFTFHDTRHNFATYFLDRHRDVHTLAAILGHSPSEAFRMTLRYAHILNTKLHDQMGSFGAKEVQS
jgi:integrase